jgi:hypothetical protein
LRYFARKPPGIRGPHDTSGSSTSRPTRRTHHPKLVLSDQVRGTSLLDVLAILDNFASQEMPERQRQIQDAVNKILTAVVKPALRSPTESLAPLIVAIKQLPAMLVKRGDDDERTGSG